MSSNVGLTTPRGSGTSGYVQRNLSHLRPRDAPYPSPSDSTNLLQQKHHHQRKPDADILTHDRLRDIEVKIFDLRDKLEDEGVEEEEIELRTEKLRKELLDEDASVAKKNGGKVGGGEVRKQGRLKSHQVHEMAAQKIAESERVRRALGIREDWEEGGYWNRGEGGMKGKAGDGEEGKGVERVKEEAGRRRER